MKIFIHQHLGLGDMILCNGLIRHLLSLRSKYDKIFLCTEEQAYLDKFKEIYGEKVIFYNSQRSFNKNRYYVYNRKNHRYKY